ncbi:hypothetical protein ABMA46_13360 [Mesorhizobium sp. CN5-321]|jgi:hypothetical protein|uniref:hypothetical protein n=1 Tax=Mesorhizobium hunchu TaxID=3157708 RepID=UPI0032B7B63B
MRFIFGLILVAGLVMIGYPRLAPGGGREPVGTWRVFQQSTGFTPVETQLTPDNSPLDVSVEMTTTGLQSLPKGAALLTVTAAANGQTVLAQALDFANATSRDTNPQTQEKAFHADVGVIDAVKAGSYTFTVDRGDADGVPIRAVDLVLSRGTTAFDKRLQPIGFSLTAIGFIGLVLAFRHRFGAPPPNPNSQPPRPRWGRGA